MRARVLLGALLLVGALPVLAEPLGSGSWNNYGLIQNLQDMGLYGIGQASVAPAPDPTPVWQLLAGGVDGDNLSGTDQLSQTFNINSTDMDLQVWCQGIDGDGGDTSINCNGTTWDETGAGALAYDAAIAAHVGEGITGDGTNYLLAPNNTAGDIATEDFVLELVFKAPPIFGANQVLFAKRPAAGGAGGWFIRVNSDGTLRCLYAQDDTDWILINASTALDVGSTYVVHAFVDRGDATDGAQCFLNGTAVGTDDATQASNTLTTATAASIHAWGDGGSGSYATVYHAALWTCSGCMPGTTAEPLEVAKARAAHFWGVYPSVTPATTPGPEVMSRGNSKYCDLYNTAGTIRTYYLIGDNSVCVARRKDAAGNTITGYFAEPAIVNKIIQSSEYDTSWTLANVTINDQAGTAPDGLTTADTIDEDGTLGQHFISQAWTGSSGVKTVYSIFLKAQNRTWASLASSNPTAYTSVNLTTCALGTTQLAGTEYFSENWGNGWCRVIMTFDSTATAQTFRVHAADSDGGITYTGTTQASILAWGAMGTQFNDFPGSYIPTTTGTVNKGAEGLRWKSDDGLIGASDVAGALHMAFTSEADYASDYLDKTLFAISDGGNAANAIDGDIDTDDVWHGRLAATAGEAGEATTTGDVLDHTTNVLKVSWGIDDLLACNPTCGTPDGTVDTIPNDLDRFEIGNGPAIVRAAGGLISDVKLYDEAFP